MLRDQTQTVRNKVISLESASMILPTRSRTSSATPATAVPSPTASCATVSAPITRSSAGEGEDDDDGSTLETVNDAPSFEINNSIVKTSAEQALLAEFFVPVIVVHGYRQSSRGYLHQLIPAYQRCPNGSLLHVATNALAFAVNSKGSQRDHLYLGQQKYARALAMMRKALVDPVECKKDDTIMAVMVLGFIQVRLGSGAGAVKVVLTMLQGNLHDLLSIHILWGACKRRLRTTQTSRHQGRSR